MNVYIIPFAEEELGDRLFGDPGRASSRRTVILWRALKESCEEEGIYLRTIDFFDPRNSRLDDALMVLDHPEESLLWRLYYLWKHRRSWGGFVWKKRRLFYAVHPYFKRKILLQLESPVVAPTAYRVLPKLAKLYTETYFIVENIDGDSSYIPPIYDIYDGRDKWGMVEKYSGHTKEKYLVMVNSNCAPHQFQHSLLGERIRAIKFFGNHHDFDLYGRRWDWRPRHPLWWFRRGFVEKAWRGTIGDKFEKLSQYKFALVIENCSYSGYISEKIFDCFVTGVVPIYLGAPDIHTFIPEDCYIDLRRFGFYAQLDAFLRKLTDSEIAAYRSAALSFLRSGKDRPFTREYFTNRLLNILLPLATGPQKESPLVSIITPAHNSEKHIAETIQSVLGQTYENWEMIITDDGSTDRTAEIVKSFQDSRIRYFHQENRGPSVARNLSLKNSRGEYIAFLDSDDIFLPNKLERQVAYLESHPQCDFCYCEVKNFRTDQPGKFWLVAMPRLSGNLKDAFIRRGGHFIGPLTVVFRRKLYDKFGGFDPSFRWDEFHLYLKFAIGGARFCFLNEILALYRFSDTGVSGEASHLKEAAQDGLKIFDWLDRILPANDPSRKWLERGRSHWQLRVALGCFILGDKHLGLKELKKAKHGSLLAPIFFILPASLSSRLLKVLRRMREKSLFKEIK